MSGLQWYNPLSLAFSIGLVGENLPRLLGLSVGRLELASTMNNRHECFVRKMRECCLLHETNPSPSSPRLELVSMMIISHFFP